MNELTASYSVKKSQSNEFSILRTNLIIILLKILINILYYADFNAICQAFCVHRPLIHDCRRSLQNDV